MKGIQVWSLITNPYTSEYTCAPLYDVARVELCTSVSSKGVSIVASSNALQIPAAALTHFSSEGCPSPTLLSLHIEGHFFQTFPFGKANSGGEKHWSLTKMSLFSKFIYFIPSAKTLTQLFPFKAAGQRPCPFYSIPLKVTSFQFSLALGTSYMKGELRRRETQISDNFFLLQPCHFSCSIPLKVIFLLLNIFF